MSVRRWPLSRIRSSTSSEQQDITEFPNEMLSAELLLAALSACVQRGKNLLIRQVSGRAKEHN